MPRPVVLFAHSGGTCGGLLTGLRYEIRTCCHSATFDSVREFCPDAIVLDVGGGYEQASLEALRAVRWGGSMVPAVLVVEQSCEQFAIAALNAGATRYVPASGGPEALDAVLREILDGATAYASASTTSLIDGERLVGDSSYIRKLRCDIARASRTNSNVLITGETGTGKELVAELIHANSDRRTQPFICLNSAAIPEALIESELFGYERGAFTGAYTSSPGKLAECNSGTLFFDEIGDISGSVQSKLLRALDRKLVYRLGGAKPLPLDIRIVAATNQNLERAMEENRFRPDLYYRLHVVRLEAPPLRQRMDDVPRLITSFIAAFNASFGVEVRRFSGDAMDALISHEWPGNVRELRNVVEAAFVNMRNPGDRVLSLPPQFKLRRARQASADHSEREAIIGALEATDWNMTKAAEQLRWSRMTLYRKLNRLHIARR